MLLVWIVNGSGEGDGGRECWAARVACLEFMDAGVIVLDVARIITVCIVDMSFVLCKGPCEVAAAIPPGIRYWVGYDADLLFQ